MTSETERQLNSAVESYKRGVPVVVLSSSGGLLHGQETCEAIVNLNLPMTSAVVYGVPVEDWNASEWPEILEAARQVFLKDAFPKGMNG